MYYKKKELLQLVDVLDKANQLFWEKDNDQILSMDEVLIEDQNAAIEIGNYLETLPLNMQSTVHILEAYCENIYNQSINLHDTDLCRDIAEKIQIQLGMVKENLTQDLPTDKKEIVFLPYKASMWDSLESAWIEAKEDSEVETYVIPIPYFEKNPDGSLGQMYYEGNEYPDYVPIIDWKDYIISERHPDIIYIHNPYDQYNHVTSVHPAFYATELKKYTDKLIYIPYFIGINNQVEEHFCTSIAVLYADQTIVESEEVKRIYLNALGLFEKENNCKGRFGDFNKKIIVRSNGKIERLKRSNSNQNEIPELWKKKMFSTDGKRKKVVFYNTSIDAMLKQSDTYLNKVESVLKLFREQQEVVLLWRPHPLLLSTIKAMRPDLLERYTKIVKDFIEDDQGIFDESSDLDRAIVSTDAYYGDMSSVVELYKSTGKPIMIQNCNVGVYN
ncbi:MAG: hypothetical protein PHY47_14630 [Lachnospiraceae bacterium]|nr:hypothetical protein [Lachnospiraceae bacterium]